MATINPITAKKVQVVEVGPRDGLQNESCIVPTAVKAEYISRLRAANVSRVEVSSFVNPKRVPQLADAAELFAMLPRNADAQPRYSALVPNRKGLERALECGVREIALFTAASETFVMRNIGMTIEQSLDEFAVITGEAKSAGCLVRAYISTAFYCPFEGKINSKPVSMIAGRLLDFGVDEISIGDTIGHAVPSDVYQLLSDLAPVLPLERTACHFHDTRGAALANVFAALTAGVTIFDSSSGGLGGCPFAPGAAGNLATEDLVMMFDGMEIETGIDVRAVALASNYLSNYINHPLPGKALQALLSDANPPIC